MSDMVQVRMQWVVLAITLTASGAGWLSVLAGDRQAAAQTLGQHEDRLQRLEQARQIDQAQLVEIRTDVRWIRQQLQSSRP